MKLLVAGDSHAQYFNVTNQMRSLMPALRGIKPVVKVVSASTISGVGKMDSTLQLGADIAKWCEEHRPDHLVLNLGQVDVELGIPFRQFVKESPEPTSHWIEYFIAKYMDYLSTLALPASRVIVKGINLPVLCYDQKKAIKYIERIVTERFTEGAESDERRKLVMERLNDRYPSDIYRTDLANLFNEHLESACRKAGYGYFDINDQLVGPVNGTIHPRFIPSKFDHHIVDSLEVREMHWARLLEVARMRIWEDDARQLSSTR